MSSVNKEESEVGVTASRADSEAYHLNKKGDVILKSGLKAGLKNRMINLIALCGIIGPGAFIGMGSALAAGGPVGLIVGFAIVGILVLSMMASVGEMNAVLDANFCVLGSKFISRGFGATLSIYYIILWLSNVISEYTSLTATLEAYTDKVPTYGWYLIFWALFSTFQTLGVTAYGELEYILGFVKLAFLTGFYIFATVYAAGGIHGHKPDNPFKNYPLNSGFKGIANSFVYAGVFYSGVEAISVIAAEARNPRKAIPTAVKTTVVRIFYVYFGLSVFYGISVPYNDPHLAGQSKVMRSPMTIAMTNAGWANAKYLVTTMIMVTCLSSINSAVYISSRTLFTLSKEGYAPKIFTIVDKKGIPWVAVHVCHLFGFLSILSYKSGSSVAYSYIIGLAGVAAFIVWTAICIIHLRFRWGWVYQGYSLDKLPFKSPLFPWFDYLAIILGIVLTLVQGWTTFSPFTAGLFVDAYILLPLFFVIWAAYDLYFREGFVKYKDMDFLTGRRPDLDDDAGAELDELELETRA